MTETLSEWLSVPLITVLGVFALYRCYILPNYKKDKEER